MKINNLKSEKGITLTNLVVYIIAIMITLGILTSISSFFYSNINLIEDSAKNASEFDKFNSYILKDVKNNSKVKVNETTKTIIFEDGTTYIYNIDDEGMYRGNAKIASNVKAFDVSQKTIVINNVEKDILTINIVIGNSTQNLINKQIDYTLKYW